MKSTQLPPRTTWYEPTYLGIDWTYQEQGHAPTNCLPVPRKEISLNQFLNLLTGRETLRGTNFRQVFVPGENTLGDATFFFFYTYAIAVVRYFTPTSPPSVLPGRVILANYGFSRQRFFQVGCTHPRRTTTWPKMFERHDDCLDCGFSAVYDTSD